MNKYTIIIGLIISIAFYACQDYESVAPDAGPAEAVEYDGTLLEYLSDQNNAFNLKFDSMLMVINAIPGLKEKLADENEFYTIFALPNECFDLSLKELNMYRTQKKLGDNISYKDLFVDPFSVNDTTFIYEGNTIVDTMVVTYNYDYRGQVDTLLSRYIFEGKYSIDEIQAEESSNITAESYKYGYQMNMECSFQTASGMQGGGVRKFTFSDMNNSMLKEAWKSTEVVQQDIYTRNAVIHILPEHHSFSFDKFINYFKNRGNEYEKD